MTSPLPRAEYPRPQFVREKWLCLNGPWEFEIDAADSGLERGLLHRPLSSTITVPFCPESKLSGIGHTDFMPAVWYRRTVVVPADWRAAHILVHFQAVDYDATVWIDGREFYRHRGGFTPFTVVLRPGTDIEGSFTIVLRARDDPRPPQPRGKQSRQYANQGCLYTRTTGVWQTVWMEPVPADAHLRRPRITPDVSAGVIRLVAPISRNRPGWKIRAVLSDAKGTVAAAVTRADLDLSPSLDLPITPERRRLWSPEDPHLYDLRIELLDMENRVVDAAASYAGLRSLSMDGRVLKLNGRPVFQRLVLDQGYYPDGILTAPTDDALKADIALSQASGFNGARLHQKVFEERFLYHADQAGYLCWGEFPDWGASGFGPMHDNQKHGITYAGQWLEALHRDYSHPCIVGWCAFNETHQVIQDRITDLDDATRAMFLAAKALDPTRPVLDASGYSHRVYESDIYDSHDYVDNSDFLKGIEGFRRRHTATEPFAPYVNNQADARQWSIPYNGQPYFVSEFGGIGFNLSEVTQDKTAVESTGAWGYGQIPATSEEFLRRFAALCDILLDNPEIFGYCYTQLTDVFQEQNGIFTFDRRPKFDLTKVRNIQRRKAAFESDRWTDPSK
jgi:beta-galactosidase/beta-glucuronidase